MSSLQTKALCLIESTYHAHKLHQPHPSDTCELAAQRRNHGVETAMTGARVLLWKALANRALPKVIQNDWSFFSKYIEGIAVHTTITGEFHVLNSTPKVSFQGFILGNTSAQRAKHLGATVAAVGNMANRWEIHPMLPTLSSF